MVKAISLFSGMGGDSLGIVNAGHDLVAYSEFIKVFRDTHDLNFIGCKMLGSDVKSDISKITTTEFEKYKDVDLIFAGFPCQGFSQAGKKLPDDPRNTLFREFLRATSIIEPEWIIGENVKGLLTRKTAEGELYIDIITEEFEKLGYTIKYKVFKVAKHGIPQRRERLLIVGCRSGKPIVFPEEQTDEVGLEKIVKFNMTGAIRVPRGIYDFSVIPEKCILTDLSNTEIENSPHPYLKLKVHDAVREYKGKTFENLLSFGKRISPIHCEIIDIRNPSKTIICTYDHQPRLFVPLRNKNGYFLRCLMPEELKQIQGFPQSYKVTGKVKEQIVQIGNAVPPPLIEAILKCLL